MSEIIRGARTIREHPDESPKVRWHGTTNNPHYSSRVWRDESPEAVEAKMNGALGTIPSREYQVEESRHAPATQPGSD